MRNTSAKVAIVGAAGGVGSATAYTLAREGIASEIVLVDTRTRVLESHRMDLEQLRPLGAPCEFRIGGEAELAEVDIVVVSASTPLRSNTTRRDYLAGALPIAHSVGLALTDRSWPGLVLVATNPIEPVCAALAAAAGLPRWQVIGYTFNDTLRLRTAIGQALRVSPERVEAWVLGEHGEHLVPLWSRVMVDKERVRLDAASRARADDYLRTWYSRIVALDSGRTTTWSTAAGLSRMVAAALASSDAVFAAAVALDGEYGVRDAVLGVPVRLGPTGVRDLLEWPLDAKEQRAFEDAAAAVRAM